MAQRRRIQLCVPGGYRAPVAPCTSYERPVHGNAVELGFPDGDESLVSTDPCGVALTGAPVNMNSFENERCPVKFGFPGVPESFDRFATTSFGGPGDNPILVQFIVPRQFGGVWQRWGVEAVGAIPAGTWALNVEISGNAVGNPPGNQPDGSGLRTYAAIDGATALALGGFAETDLNKILVNCYEGDVIRLRVVDNTLAGALTVRARIKGVTWWQRCEPRELAESQSFSPSSDL